MVPNRLPDGLGDTLLSPDQLEALRKLNGCALADAIETFGVRLLNEGMVHPSIRCLLSQPEPMLGYAATFKIRTSLPPIVGKNFPERTDWLNYLAALPSPCVLVMEDMDEQPGWGALIGAAQTEILRALRCAGVVTNGSVRDLASAQTAGLYFFAASTAVARGYAHVVEFGSPVVVGDLRIQSGDLLHGDQHGVQSIPLEIASRIPDVAAEIAAQDRALAVADRGPEFPWAALRAAVLRHEPRS